MRTQNVEPIRGVWTPSVPLRPVRAILDRDPSDPERETRRRRGAGPSLVGLGGSSWAPLGHRSGAALLCERLGSDGRLRRAGVQAHAGLAVGAPRELRVPGLQERVPPQRQHQTHLREEQCGLLHGL